MWVKAKGMVCLCVAYHARNTKDQEHATESQDRSGQVDGGQVTGDLFESTNRAVTSGGGDHGCILASEPLKGLQVSHSGLTALMSQLPRKHGIHTGK